MPSIAQFRSKQVAALPTLAEREKRYIRRVLLVCRGDVRSAATVLGVGRATLYRKLSLYGWSIQRFAPLQSVEIVQGAK